MSPWAIKRLGKAIQLGAVIAYPTDTIWGFGCHPLNPHSTHRILHIKRRAASKGLILLCSDLTYCLAYISPKLSSANIALLQQPRTRPTTWLVSASADCPAWLRGEFATVAVRITSHPFIQAICQQIKSPVVSTSANLTGKSPVRNAIQAQRLFAGQVDYIVTGYQSGTGRASEIKSLETGQIIRA